MIELLVHATIPGRRFHSRHVESMISEKKGKKKLCIILNLKY